MKRAILMAVQLWLATTLVCGAIALLVVTTTDKPTRDYEAIANCIAEYDYKHYNNNMMNNLVAALELCDE